MAIVNGYATLAEIRAYLLPSGSDTNDDALLEDAVEAASRWIDGHCNRYFYSGSATRTYVASDLYCLDIDDLASVTTVKTDEAGDGTFETTWASTDYQLLPHNPAESGVTRPYTSVEAVGTRTFPVPYGRLARRDRVQIVGTFGWSAVPDAVKQACLVLAAETFKLKDAPMGTAGFGDFGTTKLRMNPKAAMFLAAYRKHAVLVG